MPSPESEITWADYNKLKQLTKTRHEAFHFFTLSRPAVFIALNDNSAATRELQAYLEKEPDTQKSVQVGKLLHQLRAMKLDSSFRL